MDGKAEAICTKRQRDDNSVAVEKTLALSTDDTQDRALPIDADAERKKPRLEAPPKIPPEEPPVDANDSTDAVDAEAILMRALEEAIERGAMAANKKAAIPTIVDEDEDYDESD